MFNVFNLDTCNSYATEANAIKALEKKFGPSQQGARLFNVLMARNTAGRVVPVLCNITTPNLGALAAAGFMCVN
jgi:hypothetical protein